jgi:hypothetical protein
MNEHIDHLIGRLTVCMTYECGDTKYAIVRDLHWSSVNMEEADMQTLLLRLLEATNGRLGDVAVCIQVALCQVIADHRQQLPADDAGISQVFDIIMHAAMLASTDHSVNFALAEAALYALIKLCAQFPVAGSKVIGVKLMETGNGEAVDAADMRERSDGLMRRLEEIEKALPIFLNECDDRLKVAAKLRKNRELRECEDETPLEATAKEKRMGSNIRLLCGCLRSADPLRAVLPRWLSWHGRPFLLTGRDPLRDALRETRRSRRRATGRRDPEGSSSVVSDDSS